MLAFALRKTSLVKDNFRTGALLGEIELHNRVDTWIPVDHTPGLDNSFVRHKLDVSSYDMPAKKRERTARFPADLRALVSRRHAGLPGRTEQCDPLELLFVGQCFVHALRIRFEDWFLVYGFCGTRNLLLNMCQCAKVFGKHCFGKHWTFAVLMVMVGEDRGARYPSAPGRVRGPLHDHPGRHRSRECRSRESG